MRQAIGLPSRSTPTDPLLSSITNGTGIQFFSLNDTNDSKTAVMVIPTFGPDSFDAFETAMVQGGGQLFHLTRARPLLTPSASTVMSLSRNGTTHLIIDVT